MTPKISVLIPMYNRKHYIADAVDSVLNQAFRDIEIVICDDGSKDGSADFVAKRYAAEIFAGKIKLLRNEKNIGEFPTDNRLLREATGKYVMILHSDDFYLSQALEQMYTAAEYFNADVVHAGTFLQLLANGITDGNAQFKVMCWENRRATNFELVDAAPATRFNEWLKFDTFIDAQYNIFRRKFLIDNEIFFADWMGNLLFCLHWLMKAAVYVKTPDIFYVRRDAPDSSSNDQNFLARKVYQYIHGTARLSRYFDKLFSSVDYFKDNAAIQYHVKAIFYNRADDYRLHRLKIYANGITPEVHRAAEQAIKECFGAGADYVTFMFHKVHCLPFEQDYNKISSQCV